jgi:hypothetical protein
MEVSAGLIPANPDQSRMRSIPAIDDHAGESRRQGTSSRAVCRGE